MTAMLGAAILIAGTFEPEPTNGADIHGASIETIEGRQFWIFDHADPMWVDLGHGPGDELRITGPLTVAAVVRMKEKPPAKVAVVSKWRLAEGARSYELGVLPSGYLFFTLSETGSWDRQGRELTSSWPLTPGETHFVTASFAPGESMTITIDGEPAGRTERAVPDQLYDSETPVYIGNRPGHTEGCGFPGWVGEVLIEDESWSEDHARQAAEARGLSRPAPEGYEPLEPPYDLDEVKERTREWYSDLQAPDLQYGAYRLTQGQPADLYAAADIAWIRYIMRDLELSDSERAEWVDFIQDQQRPDDGGYDHITGHCATHAFCHATGALNMLGADHRHRPAILDPYRDIAGIDEWLDGINWHHQWGASHDIWGAGLPIACDPETPEDWREEFFHWLDKENNPTTGMWRIGQPAANDLEALGGAFHIWPLYAAVDRPLPHPERVIDHVLDLQQPSGSFEVGGFGYGNMDGVWVLAYLMPRTGYRRAEVRAALEAGLDGLIELYNTERGAFFTDAHGTESRISTLGILSQALPERVQGQPWLNPWHQPELFDPAWEGEN
jgi:hypothetical protein